LDITILVQEIKQSNFSLEHLGLSSNKLSNDDYVVLFGLLPSCPRLTTIDVGYNPISNLKLPMVNNNDASRLGKLMISLQNYILSKCPGAEFLALKPCISEVYEREKEERAKEESC
jgi:hypothetical protein